MFKHYLIMAYRILTRNMLFSAINIGGLTVGLCGAFLIILFVRNEQGYDKWMQDRDRIFTIQTESNAPGRASRTLARTPLEVRAAMEKDFPTLIESFTRFYAGTAPVKIGNDIFPEKSFRIEETFFDVFNFQFQNGDAATALATANSAVISEELAQKYYPGEIALNQTISVEETDYRITAIIAELPGKTHLGFDILLFDGAGALNIDFIDWTSSRLYSYIKLHEGQNIDQLAAATADFLDRNAFFAPESWQDYRPSDVMDFSYLALSDVHLYQNAQNPISPGGSATLVYGFIGIAGLIMVMASINFINLSTANASLREKEIALHKVVGAKRGQLIIRHLLEAIVLVSFAFILAMALTEILSQPLFSWLGLGAENDVSIDLSFVLIAGTASFLTGILAGIYPAFLLSSKSPAQAFSGGRSNPPRVALFRLGLIFFQYSISIILMIAAAHFYLQTKLSTEMDLGFSDENVVSYWGIGGAENSQSQIALIERVRQVPGVLSATRMAQVPGNGSQNNVSLKPIGADSSMGGTRIQSVAASTDFDQTLNMEIIAGRSFQSGRDIDLMIADKEAPSSIVINELALSALGIQNADDAIGRKFEMQDYLFNPVTVEIIGVIKNAHFQTIHTEMVPMLFANADVFFNAMVIKVQGDPTTSLDAIDAIWPEYVPDVAVLRTFLADDLIDRYQTESQQTNVFSLFALLAIFIAFLGIFGLAAFSANQKTKEVGIRKVFGASISDIEQLFIWQFTKPVMWAVLAAWPIAGILLNNWLESYAYRIDLMPLIFISAAASVLFIAWITIATHAVRVARMNPVIALRYE